ncbi:AAA family ATPase [Stenotrophomonas acidaminiphila]|uniref:AAA family ATPase n=1 Tax=Stenotrophomonas acidaminiphila TaxID=128780 RepID=UPI0028B0DE39|nr:AAA family ATPase [Stenotrophomonas acidaminiphila]
MNIFGTKPTAPEDVFTPRKAVINEEMYMPRPSLETALKQGLRGNVHLVIHGDSGTGKSWLYKKTFSDLKATSVVANLANAARLGSISSELDVILDEIEPNRKIGDSQQKDAKVSAAVLEGGISQTNDFEIARPDPFRAVLKHIRKKAGDGYGVLVFDNLEAIFSDEKLLREIASLILLCDDERYAQYRVKILLVGVPNDVKNYFYRTDYLTTVASRLTELPEVDRLTVTACNELIKKGFTDKLQYKVYSLEDLQKHVSWVTGRIPLHVHEYCLELAFKCETSRLVTESDVTEADVVWLSKNHMNAYSVVESHMNEKDTKAGRRNQTLFCISLIDKEQFKSSDVEEVHRREFPNSTQGIALNTSQTLASLTAGDNPIIKRTPKGDAFTFTYPLYRLALRAMLIKTTDERVERRSST